MSERTYYDGKYTVKARTDGGLEFLLYGEAWPAADDLRFNNLLANVLAPSSPNLEREMKPIEEMTGLELREAVAVEVMGWQRHELIDATVEFPRCRWCGSTFYHGDPRDGWYFQGEPPAYESSIEAAFQVVEKLEAAPENWLFKAVRQCGVLTRQVDKLAWMCEFRACIGPAGHCFYAIGADEKSLPLAICRAALTAIRARKA